MLIHQRNHLFQIFIRVRRKSSDWRWRWRWRECKRLRKRNESSSGRISGWVWVYNRENEQPNCSRTNVRWRKWPPIVLSFRMFTFILDFVISLLRCSFASSPILLFASRHCEILCVYVYSFPSISTFIRSTLLAFPFFSFSSFCGTQIRWSKVKSWSIWQWEHTFEWSIQYEWTVNVQTFEIYAIFWRVLPVAFSTLRSAIEKAPYISQKWNEEEKFNSRLIIVCSITFLQSLVC